MKVLELCNRTNFPKSQIIRKCDTSLMKNIAVFLEEVYSFNFLSIESLGQK